MKTTLRSFFAVTFLVLSTIPVSLHAQNQQATSSVASEEFGPDQGDWFADNGVWEIGFASAGPADTSNHVAGTVLNGRYPAESHSRLISPVYEMPDDSSMAGDKLRLSFRQWYSFNSSDSGVVQITTDGLSWATIPGTQPVSGISEGWESVIIPDLSAYTGQQIQLGFLFFATDPETSDGWYIDDISIYKEAEVPSDGLESFSPPVLDWIAENGIWEVGVPRGTSHPAHALTGIAATVLNGSYPQSENARLISPKIDITDESSTRPKLKFRHWFDFADQDAGIVQLSVNDGDWLDLAGPFTGTSGGWSKFVLPELNVSLEPGDYIKIAFLLEANNTGANNAGWYVDEFKLQRDNPTDIVIIKSNPGMDVSFGPEDPFSEEKSEWFSENGVWQTGGPTSGPGSANTDSLVAATLLDGNYPNGASSRFVSPRIMMPDEPFGISFWHWFDFSAGDHGIVQASINNDEWVDISNQFANSSGVWTRFRIPNINLAMGDAAGAPGDTLRIAFQFTSQASGATRAGWYLDDIVLEDVFFATVTSNESIELPNRVDLHQNYPNPFNPSTSISFTMKDADHVSIKIYDVLGRQVATLMDGFMPPGPHSVAWDATGQASGVYLYRLETQAGIQTRQMMLVK